MQDYDSASSCQGIYDALPNLEPFVQFKKRLKTPMEECYN